MRLSLQGEIGGLYGIEATRDLQVWTNWVVVTTDSGGVAAVDLPSSVGERFYRASAASSSEAGDPAEVAIGERLFLETRFAQFFFARNGSDVNRSLESGDPALELTMTLENPVPGPFRGTSMNCRACHLVDEHHDRLGNRTYADFAARSPIPDRGDGRHTTPRNSPALVNASLTRSGPFFLHFDAEFPDGPSLVKGTFTGRNFGWLATEADVAVKHLARVIREDTAADELGQAFGGAYRLVLAGIDPTIPVEFRLPEAYRIDVSHASDEDLSGAARWGCANGRAANRQLRGLPCASSFHGFCLS